MEPGPNREVEEVVNDLMSEFLNAGHREIEDMDFRAVLGRIARDEDG